jgi:hypothetical protein
MTTLESMPKAAMNPHLRLQDIIVTVLSVFHIKYIGVAVQTTIF